MKCPNCGAENLVDELGRCLYCNDVPIEKPQTQPKIKAVKPKKKQ